MRALRGSHRSEPAAAASSVAAARWAAALLGILAVATGPQGAAATAESESFWWYPTASIAKAYDFDGSLSKPFVSTPPVAAPPRPARRQLVLLGEGESDRVVRGSAQGQSHEVGIAAVAAQAAASSNGTGAVPTVYGQAANTGARQQLLQQQAQQQVQQQAQQQQAQQQVQQAQEARHDSGEQGGQQIPPPHKSVFSFFKVSISFAFLVKAACMLSNVLSQASPLPVVRKYELDKDTGTADSGPLMSVAYGGWQWCFYGFFAYLVTEQKGFLVVVYSNCFGAFVGLYYLFVFQRHCQDANKLQRVTKYCYMLAVIIVVQALAICVLPPLRALFFSGLISSAWSMMGSLSLLATLPEVFETKNSKSLPRPILVCGLICCWLWVTCGFMLHDPMIWFPNGFSALVCTYALLLCFMYPSAADHEAAGISSGWQEGEATPGFRGLSRTGSELEWGGSGGAQSAQLSSRNSPTTVGDSRRPVASSPLLRRALERLLLASMPTESTPPLVSEAQQSAGYGTASTGGTGDTC